MLPCRGRGRSAANIGCNCHPYAAETFKITFVQPHQLRHADGGNFLRTLQTGASSTFASGPRSLSAPLAAALRRYFRRQFWSTATPQTAILPRTLPHKQLGLHFFGTPPPMFRGGCRGEESIQHCGTYGTIRRRSSRGHGCWWLASIKAISSSFGDARFRI